MGQRPQNLADISLSGLIPYGLVLLLVLISVPLTVHAQGTATSVTQAELTALYAAGEHSQATARRGPLALTLNTPHGRRTFALVPHDIRGPNYRTGADGAMERVTPRVRLFKGVGEDGGEAISRFAVIDDPETRMKSLRGLVELDGDYYEVAPRGGSLYDVVRASGEAERGNTCGIRENTVLKTSRQTTPRHPLSRSLHVLELATEADFTYVQHFGGLGAANAEILAVLNGVDGFYRSELGIRIQVNFQHGWVNNAEPYSNTSDSVKLLDEFRKFWNDTFSTEVEYDVAHLWSQRGLDAGGLAVVQSICTPARYSLNVARTRHDAIVTVAHEIGHNLGADHDLCATGEEWIMCGGVDPPASKFSPESKERIAESLSLFTCLARETENSPPNFGDIESQTVTAGEVLYLSLVATDTDGDPLTFTAISPLPLGASLDTHTGRFAWRPFHDQRGNYTLQFQVSDPSRSFDTTAVKIQVQPNLSAPILPSKYTNGDFSGSGEAALALFRQTTGEWLTLESESNVLTGFMAEQFGLPGDLPIVGDFNGDRISDYAVFRVGTSTWFIQHSGSKHITATQFGLFGDVPSPADYDGDGRTDIAVFRPSSGLFIVKQSTDNETTTLSFGLPGDIPLPCDYDGSGAANLGVYRPALGLWIYRSKGTDKVIQFGFPADIPQPSDFNGDGRCELVVWRPGTGEWLHQTGERVQYGLPGDIPIATDFNGDGRTEHAVFRSASGQWFIRGVVSGNQFGLPGDQPVVSERFYYAARKTSGDTRLVRNGEVSTAPLYLLPRGVASQLTLNGGVSTPVSAPAGGFLLQGDYDGDALIDYAVFFNGVWNLRYGSGAVGTVHWGVAGDQPASGDFDGDGRSDIAVFRPNAGGGFSEWYVIRSSDGAGEGFSFGLSGDQPIPADFNGDGFTDAAVWRPAVGMWFVRDARSGALIEQRQWGLPGDVIRTADFDFDGKPDLSVYRSGVWFIQRSAGGISIAAWGLPGDMPVPGVFTNPLFADFAIYRPGDGAIYVLGQTGFAAIGVNKVPRAQLFGLAPHQVLF